MKQDIHDYHDIYEIKRPELRHHKKMPMEKRVAQFMPFSALDGYDDSIKEEERQTEERKIMVPEEQDRIRMILTDLSTRKHIRISVLYFQNDEKKKGGYYQNHVGMLRRMDEEKKSLIFDDGTEISYDEIDDIKIFDDVSEEKQT